MHIDESGGDVQSTGIDGSVKGEILFRNGENRTVFDVDERIQYLSVRNDAPVFDAGNHQSREALSASQ